MRTALEKQNMLETIDREMELLQSELDEARSVERLDRLKGLSYDMWGNSLAVLYVKIHEGKDLPSTDMFTGSADPFVKIELVPTLACPGTTVQHTETKWACLNPIFEQEFSFKAITTRDAVIRVTLMDNDKVGKPDYVAQVEIPFSSFDKQGSQ